MRALRVCAALLAVQVRQAAGENARRVVRLMFALC
jgi:hypothetical protein